jgi:NAD(P)-dependent dehydrogenase (short-subunit alcohol dehydrogenase family)
MQLNGKVAIVTGASRGIGRQIALELARRGVAVAVAARTVEVKNRLPGTVGETVAAIEAVGGRAIAVQTDVTQEADLRRLVETTVKTFGRLDILVNNAADTRGVNAPIEDYARDIWVRQFDSNVHAPFTLMSLAVQHLKTQGGGVIVNMTTSEAEIDFGAEPEPGSTLGVLIGYGSSKAALNRLSNALAHTLAPDNITVALVDPGFTRTELVDLMGERGLVDPGRAHPMEWPVSDVMEIITSDNPKAYAGKIIRTATRHTRA